MDQHPRAVGVAWFRKADYAALRSIFADGHKMPATWEQWLRQAEQMESQAKANFDVVERVYIDPTTFAAWCAQNETTVDRHGRHKFIAMTIAEKYGGTH